MGCMRAARTGTYGQRKIDDPKTIDRVTKTRTCDNDYNDDYGDLMDGMQGAVHA